MERNHKKNHLKRKNSKSFPWKLSAETPKEQGSFHLFPLPSLFFLSPLSSFPLFSLSPTTPKGIHTINPSFWSIKEAWGGSKLPPPQVNRLAPLSLLPVCQRPGARTPFVRATARPDFQKNPIFSRSAQHVKLDCIKCNPISFHINSSSSPSLYPFTYIYIYINKV